MKTCSKCGRTFPDKDIYCNTCGNLLTEVSTEPNQVGTANANSDAPQQEQQILCCPNCRQPIQSNWQVCAYCGTGLKMAPQPQGYPVTGYDNNSNQMKSTNPIAIFALILGLALLFSPFLQTWRTTGFLGLAEDVSFVETVFIDQDDRDEYNRMLRREKEGYGRNPRQLHNYFLFLGWFTIFLFAFSIVSYILSLRAFAEKKLRKFWNLLRISGWFGLLGTLLAAGCFLGFKSIYKDFLDKTNYSIDPTAWQFIMLILAIVVICLCSAMKKKEKETPAS